MALTEFFAAAKCLLQSFFVVVLPLVVLGYIWIRPFYVDQSVPGPRRHPLIGVTFGDTSDFIDDVAFDWAHWPTLSIVFSRKFGFRTWGGPSLNIGFGGAFFNIVSPRCLEYILRDNFENYVKGFKGKLSRSFKELMGDFAFNTDGKNWMFHRKVAVQLLNRRTVQDGASVLHGKLLKLEKILQEKNGEVFDFQKIAYSLTMDVFGKIGFGLDLDGLGSDKHDVFVAALDELNFLIHLRFDDLLWEIKQRFGLGRRERRISELTKVINAFAEEIIVALKDKKLEAGSDIVSRYLASCKKQNLPPPTNQEIRNLVIGFIFAGRDSTSVAMAWTLYEMTKHPVVVEKIRTEAKQVAKGRDLTYELVQNMPYLHAVVMESLRLHPSAPESFRFSVNDDVLPDGTRIPANSLVMFSINTINHSEKVWDEPEKFRPERFEGKEPGQFEFCTFSGGPRTCPGKSLALMELKMCLAFFLTRFDFENASNHQGTYRWTTVMAMEGGFPVRAIPVSSQ